MPLTCCDSPDPEAVECRKDDAFEPGCQLAVEQQTQQTIGWLSFACLAVAAPELLNVCVAGALLLQLLAAGTAPAPSATEAEEQEIVEMPKLELAAEERGANEEETQFSEIDISAEQQSNDTNDE